MSSHIKIYKKSPSHNTTMCVMVTCNANLARKLLRPNSKFNYTFHGKLHKDSIKKLIAKRAVHQNLFRCLYVTLEVLRIK